MIIEQLNIASLESIVSYLLKNRFDAKKLLTEFGDVIMDNGHNTFFLKPRNEIFSVLSMYLENNKINSIRFGGLNFELELKDLIKFYPKFNEGFIPYDDNYVYVFYKDEERDYTIEITSKVKLNEKDMRLSTSIIDILKINLI
ncbi:MAG: hypothetical protein JWR50_3290 [Mucilaginibacter sp.]|nr:hypothetical protein [Mucilaginibacter sp.]